MAGPGRDQTKAMTRLVRLMAKLHNEAPNGVLRDDLLELAEYGEADAATQLGKDLGHLRRQGWQIDNVAGPGEEARYRMVSGDNRLRLRLSHEQLAALHRAVILVDRADLASRLGVKTTSLPQGLGSVVLPHEERGALTLVLQGLRLQSRVRFRYKGKARVVHPAAVRFQHVQWYLSGVEEGDAEAKNFAVGRMSGISLGPPGSGPATAEVRRLQLHPLLWEVDPPLEVVLRVAEKHVPDVVRWLQEPLGAVEAEGNVEMTYRVTNQTAFRARLYVLGTRVRVAGPQQFREELLSELRELVAL